jgi:hypothetical protein
MIFALLPTQSIAPHRSAHLCPQASLKEFVRKRDNGELGVSRAQSVLSAATANRELTKSADGFVHYGDTVVVVNAETGRSLSYSADALTQPSDDLPCVAAAIPGAENRNAFVIGPNNKGAAAGAVVNFGDRFSLIAQDPFGSDRLLHSERISLHGGASLLSGKQAIKYLTSTGPEAIGLGELWEVVAVDPDTRLELAGSPVPINTPVLLKHAGTNTCVAWLSDSVVRSQLGVDPEIVCHNVLSVHKRELPPNIWILQEDAS